MEQVWPNEGQNTTRYCWVTLSEDVALQQRTSCLRSQGWTLLRPLGVLAGGLVLVCVSGKASPLTACPGLQTSGAQTGFPVAGSSSLSNSIANFSSGCQQGDKQFTDFASTNPASGTSGHGTGVHLGASGTTGTNPIYVTFSTQRGAADRSDNNDDDGHNNWSVSANIIAGGNATQTSTVSYLLNVDTTDPSPDGGNYAISSLNLALTGVNIDGSTANDFVNVNMAICIGATSTTFTASDCSDGVIHHIILDLSSSNSGTVTGTQFNLTDPATEVAIVDTISLGASAPSSYPPFSNTSSLDLLTNQINQAEAGPTVPEPATFGLVGCALLGLGFLKRKRKG